MTLGPTRRLDHEDVGLEAFEARVLAKATYAHASLGARPSLVLDQSAFYPESGGQLADRGELAGVRVLDVQLDDDGLVHHVLETEPDVGEGGLVRGAIDRPRRFEHMALHSAQHLLSRALLDVAGAETVSSRLGESSCTIDVDRDGIGPSRIEEAEALVTRIIDEDRAVRAWFPTSEELAALALRRAPKQSSNIRVVSFEGFDVSPCGGTHVTRTSQVQLCRIEGVERYKGGTRVTFVAGPRARRVLTEHDRVLRDLGRELVCPPRDVPAALARLRQELEASRDEVGRLRAARASELARRALDDARGSTRPDRVVVILDDGGPDLAKRVAAQLTAEGAHVAVVAAPIEGGVHVICARAPGSSADCGALFKALAAHAGGRGGGRAERAEGRLAAGHDLAALVAALP